MPPDHAFATAQSSSAGQALPLTRTPSIVVISDRIEGWAPPEHFGPSQADCAVAWHEAPAAERPWPNPFPGAPPMSPAHVTGGYLERLPLAAIAAGLARSAEIWHHHAPGHPRHFTRETPFLARRSFAASSRQAPTRSADMLAFLHRFGAPHILVVLGLGVDRSILDACAHSLRIYNSIDAPSLRVPPEVSAAFDLVLTGAQWQSDEVAARHPGLPTAIMPIGPEFAAPDLFRPLGLPKLYDLVYVAAAQPYKRHDILFDAMARLPRGTRALCVFGYGELADAYRDRAAREGLAIDFVGPPGVSFDEVNRLMNQARIGLVCGEHDGAPAILTEYMLAGLPVLANEKLCCGRQFILPQTGRLAAEADFPAAINDMLARLESFTPRDAVLARWTWPHTVERFAAIVAPLRTRKGTR